MQANISLIFNLVLLAGVIFAIFRIVRKQPNIDTTESSSNHTKEFERDDIISVRKIQPKDTVVPMKPYQTEPSRASMNNASKAHQLFFLIPKQRKVFSGYDLLQSLLAAKLRFGEKNFFHYYQQKNGITETLFSVTATSETGEFDLNQMTAFTTRGLCLFMSTKESDSETQQARDCLMATAAKLCQLLDAVLLDENQQPVTMPEQPVIENPESV